MFKLLPKIFIIIFFFVFILQLAGLIVLLTVPQTSQAAGATGSWDENTGVNFVPQVGIDTTFQKDQPYAISKDTKAIGEYIKSIYKYAIGAVGILAAIVLMFGGIIWITAGGSAEKIGEAKAWITASLTGLIIALCSYMILYTVNPNLVNFKITTIKTVTDTTDTSDDLSSPYCEQIGDYCIVNNQIGYCYNGVCKVCLGEGVKCSANYECCGGDCESVNGVYVCNASPESDCVGVNNGEICTTTNGGKGYCENEECKSCKNEGFSCSSIFANYECCNGDCELTTSGIICN